jgi:K+-sensing histidine kinase KdpD
MRPGGSADVRELSVLEVGRRALLGAAIATAAAWVFVPAETAQVVVAVVLPLVAAAASWYGGREVGAVAAVTGAIWFGFAHTVPRFHFEIEARADVVLTLAVLVAGVLASELAHARRSLRVLLGDTVKG